jgi:hypothetical protein
MKRLRVTALLVVIVLAAVGAPGYVIAAGCDPASGCCGTGQTYVGQQLFPNPAAPYQVSPDAAASPRQTTKPANVVSTVKKTPVAQSKTAPVFPLAPKVAGNVLDILTFSYIPCLGTLW